MIVFVYGTLKRGNFLHTHLSGAEYIGRAQTVSDKFRMFCNGAFPYVVSVEEGYRIIGELYRVNSDTLARLDRVERGYTRTAARFESHGVIISGELYLDEYKYVSGLREVYGGEWFAPVWDNSEKWFDDC